MEVKTMTILLPAALVIVGLMVWGLVTSRTRRGVNRRHFAAFVGFIAALVAVTGTTVELVLADLHPHSMSPAWQGLRLAYVR
jgi:archaellum biogenesis protein FlaJ (TadC family)